MEDVLHRCTWNEGDGRCVQAARVQAVTAVVDHHDMWFASSEGWSSHEVMEGLR